MTLQDPLWRHKMECAMTPGTLSADLSVLLEALYAGPLEEDPWQEFLSLCSSRLNAMAATLILRPLEGNRPGLMINSGGEAKFETAYQEHYFEVDLFVGMRPREVGTLHERIAQEDLEKSDFYRHYLKPTGSGYILGVDLPVPGVDARFRITRGTDSYDFDEQDKEFVRLLVPHLEQAIKYFTRLHKLESERDLYANTVNQLSVGTMILDSDGKVLDINEKAQGIISLNDGVSVINGFIDLGIPRKTAELKSHIRSVLNAQHTERTALVKAVSVERRSGDRDFSLVVKPIPTAQWYEGKTIPAVAIFISDPDAVIAAPESTLSTLFGLTNAEATVSLLLANDLSLDDVAEELGITRNTVRAHLRAIFSKTGVTKQTMLVRMILKSTAELGHVPQQSVHGSALN